MTKRRSKTAFEETMNSFKRGRIDEDTFMDLIFAAFYFAGQFGQKIPIEEGRKAFRLFVKTTLSIPSKKK